MCFDNGVSNLKNCAVRNKLVEKFSDDEMEMHSKLLNNFCHAIQSANMPGILHILHENGRFFNDLNKQKAARIICKMIHGPNGIKSRNFLKINHGISLGVFPGQEILELRSYNEQVDENSTRGNQHCFGPNFGEPQLDGKDEIIYRFVFRFYENKISNIQLVQKAIANPDRIISNN
jgi:hypothetical protein